MTIPITLNQLNKIIHHITSLLTYERAISAALKFAYGSHNHKLSSPAP